ncbi:MAG TPA: hypothetical protein DCQ06_10175, partial [Myxococcales bacterium]|nr:hypothetical protein [Myxococcales bacterium]
AVKSVLLKPQSLPSFNLELALWSVSRRARMLIADASTSMANGDRKAALPPLVEANQLDPSLTDARLMLARLYAQDGRMDTARALLKPLAESVDTCGGCVEALQIAVKDPDFRALFAGKNARFIKQAASKNPLPWQEWGLQGSSTMRDGTGKLLPRFIHPQEPFTLVRSCPSCSNPSRHTPSQRQLFGPHVAVKLASRFNTSHARFVGTKLSASPSPKRLDRCLIYEVADPIPVNTASLRTLCFRPVTLDRAALTKIEVVYGRTSADLLKNNIVGGKIPKAAAPQAAPSP